MFSYFFFTISAKVVTVGLIYSGQSSPNWPGGWTAFPTAELALEKIKEFKALPDGVEVEIVPIDSG